MPVGGLGWTLPTWRQVPRNPQCIRVLASPQQVCGGMVGLEWGVRLSVGYCWLRIHGKEVE